jgi:hypothetical protein
VKAVLGKLNTDEKYKGRGLAGIDELLADQKKLDEFAGENREVRQALGNIRATRADITTLSTDVAAAMAPVEKGRDDQLDALVRRNLSDTEGATHFANRRAAAEKSVAEIKAYATPEGQRQTAITQEYTHLANTGGNFAQYGAAATGEGLSRISGASATTSHIIMGTAAEMMRLDAMPLFAASRNRQRMIDEGTILPATAQQQRNLDDVLGKKSESTELSKQTKVLESIDSKLTTNQEILNEVKAGNGTMRGKETQARAMAAGGPR